MVDHIELDRMYNKTFCDESPGSYCGNRKLAGWGAHGVVMDGMAHD